MRSKGLLIISSLAVAAGLSCGCDFIRTVAGRPTSEELQVIANQRQEQARIEEQEREEQQRRLKAEADSLAAVKNLEGATFRKLSSLNVGFKEELPGKYCIVLGAFSSEENARKLCELVSAAGFKSVELPYRSGRVGVAAVPTDSYVELGQAYPGIKAAAFCPDDAWVLVNE